MNRSFIALILVVVFGAVAFAQVPQGRDVFKKEWSLHRFDLPEKNLGTNEIKCGPYLVGATQDEAFLIVGVVIIPVEFEGQKRDKHLFFGSGKVWETVIDENKKEAPTVEYTDTNIAVVDAFLANEIGALWVAPAVTVKVRLTQADYDAAARCLPPPEKQK